MNKFDKYHTGSIYRTRMNAGAINRAPTIIAIFFWLLFCLNAWPDDISSAPAMDTFSKAVRLYEAKDWDAAKNYFHQYLAEYSDTPLYVTCLYYLAYCYQQLGDKTEAVLLYHKVIDQAQGGDAFWADMAQRRIDKLVEGSNSF